MVIMSYNLSLFILVTEGYFNGDQQKRLWFVFLVLDC